MMELLNINNDYYNILLKLRKIIKDIFDIELENEIKEFIKQCEIGYIISEKKEIKNLIYQKEYDKVKSIYEKILNEFKSDYITKILNKNLYAF